MPKVYVGVGSNMDRIESIRCGLRQLCGRFADVRASPVYCSAALGFDGAPFYNLVASWHADMPAAALRLALRGVEAACGRDRSGPRYGDRRLDLDLLLYGDWVGEVNGAAIPDPDILNRAFILRPLSDLAGERHHPQLGRSFRALWQAMLARAGDQMARPVPDWRWPPDLAAALR